MVTNKTRTIKEQSIKEAHSTFISHFICSIIGEKSLYRVRQELIDISTQRIKYTQQCLTAFESIWSTLSNPKEVESENEYTEEILKAESKDISIMKDVDDFKKFFEVKYLCMNSRFM